MKHSHGGQKPIKSLWLLAALASMPLMSVRAQPETPSATNDLADRELRGLEEQLGRALANSDIDELNRLWADDFVSTMADGRVVSREKRLASLRAKPRDAGSKVTSSNDRIHVRAYGDWAVVLVTSSWHLGGSRVGDPYQATHVWAKQLGGWRLVAAHISPVKPARE